MHRAFGLSRISLYPLGGTNVGQRGVVDKRKSPGHCFFQWSGDLKRCLTWIRTKTGRTKNCSATITP